jgi:tRNA pseudouridine55 synthase
VVRRRGRNDLHGILIVDKPQGLSSAAVVAKISKRFNLKRVGHAGTLDPLATGVLPVCINEATKLAGLLSESGKRYVVSLKLGESTDTQDMEGQVIETRPVTILPSCVVETMGEFVGAINQIPPMYSAKKRDGRPLYELARKGQDVERKAVPVHVYQMDIRGIDLPSVQFEVDVSKGFYIRTLCHDIGERLECGAHMTSLRRTRHGLLTIEQSVPLSVILDGGEDALEAHLIPLTDPKIGIPLLKLDDRCAALVATGQPLTAKQVRQLPDPLPCDGSTLVRAIDSENRMCALMHFDVSPDRLEAASDETIVLSIERGFVLG